MGGALLDGWLKEKLTPVVVIEPHPSARLKGVAARNRVSILSDLAKAPARPRACVVALKPQILAHEAPRLAFIARSGTLVISIAAGTTIGSLKAAWGPRARIVRAMPNVAGAIGRGISGLYAPAGVPKADRALAERLMSALGATIWVGRESLIDAVTAVSGSGPAYFLLMTEALEEAGTRKGLPRAIAKKLARATLAGTGALLDFDRRDPTEIRESVTSPNGTTAAALSVLAGKGGLRPLVARAVAKACKRGAALGRSGAKTGKRTR
jgi:pyrroline-5-carboxylate reductase